jgi:hypothetical protein
MISKKTTKTVRTGQGKRINRIGSSDAKAKHLDREPLHISGVTIKIISQTLMKVDTLYPDNEHEKTHRSIVSDFRVGILMSKT